MEPQMSSLFNDMALPPSLKAFTTTFQPGSASFKANSGLDNSLQPTSFGFNNSMGFEMPSLNKVGDNKEHSNNVHQEQSGIPNNNMNDVQLQNSLLREAGSGSSTPSAISASSAHNSMYRTSSVDSQLALLRNEMVFCIFSLGSLSAMKAYLIKENLERFTILNNLMIHTLHIKSI